ncbi:hypothetical protein V1477_000227 [Vespula maculifrons]|uniref:Uncharacterized protein n=1 Tax=Vespula maculifrons TaxID=7453 RepID=A0ABD2D2A8_VESMC
MYLKILDCMRHLYEITPIITIYISNSIIIDQIRLKNEYSVIINIALCLYIIYEQCIVFDEMIPPIVNQKKIHLYYITANEIT